MQALSRSQPGRRHLLLSVLLVAALAFPLSASALAATAPDTAQAQEAPTVLNWTQVSNAPGVYYYTLVFPTPSVGYALGGPDWNVNDGIGPAYISKTTNGGQSWTTTQIPNTNRFMRGLTCTDANNCWISGASSPRMQRTSDGAATWSNVVDNSGWSGWLWSAGWTRQGTTIMMGTTGYADEPGRRANFLRATDGYDFRAVIANDPREFVVYDFSCPSPGVCYAAAKQTAFYTSNDGANWTRRVLPIARYYGIWCTDNNTCWEVGGSNGATTDGVVHIYRTTDGGLTWQQNSASPLTGNRPRLYNVQMVDAQHGYAVGCTNASDPILEVCDGQGLMLRTDDGVSWQQIASPNSADITDLYVINMDDVFVVDWNGKIWHGTTNPPTAVKLGGLEAGAAESPAPLPITGMPVAALPLAAGLALAGAYAWGASRRRHS